MMKTSITCILSIALLAGCANTVTRATPAELRAAPGSTWSFTSQRSFDSAYRKTLEQMKACYERKLGLVGTAQATVSGDRTDTEGQVSWAFSSMLSYKVFATIVLDKMDSGTRITLYAAGDKPPPVLTDILPRWINEDAAGCPGDN